MFKLSSPAFSAGGPIPRAHTCDGADVSPPLVWGDSPDSTKEFALIMDDPDAPVGTWVHWVLYKLPAAVTKLASGFPTEAETSRPVTARQGTNDFRKVGYGGPCPPRGPAHRYFFKLYALGTELTLPPGASKTVLLDAIEGHVLAEAQMMGKYGR